MLGFEDGKTRAAVAAEEVDEKRSVCAAITAVSVCIHCLVGDDEEVIK